MKKIQKPKEFKAQLIFPKRNSRIRNIISNIFCALFGNRQFRNNLRSILHNGLFRSLKLLSENKKHTKFKYFLSIGAIVKNEPDLVEWIEFNHKAGVEKFFIYDNESTDGLYERLEPYIKSGLVDYTYCPGKQMQNTAYDDCVARHKFKTKWLAFIDADEFLLPLDKDLIEVLKNIPKNAKCLAMPWVCFGSSGHITRPKGGIVKNYLHRMPDDLLLAHSCKSVLNPRLIVQTSQHISFGFGYTYDVNYKKVKFDSSMRSPLPMTGIVVNHYWCKSKVDFDKRWTKGDAVFANKRKEKSNNEFEFRDRNEVYDDRAIKFLKAKK